MSEFNFKDYVANNPLLNEALESMGTADEDTMKYLNSLGKDKLVALEKQFVDMFDTLRDIRYDGSEQLSKGASEISQRIHNFFTIIRQVRKGNPVVKEETIDEGLLDLKSPSEIRGMIKTLKNASRIIQSLKFYGTERQQIQADKLYGTGALGRLITLMELELENKK